MTKELFETYCKSNVYRTKRFIIASASVRRTKSSVITLSADYRFRCTSNSTPCMTNALPTDVSGRLAASRTKEPKDMDDGNDFYLLCDD